MSKIVTLLSVLALFTANSFSQDAKKTIENVFSNTDSQMNISVDLTKYQGFTIPEPSNSFSIDGKGSSETADPYLYFPIQIKGIYEYEYTSSEFIGAKKVTVEYKGYSEKDSMAQAVVTYYNKSGVKSYEFNVKIESKGIVASDSILAGSRIEIPFPFFKGKEWTENQNKNRVSTFSAKAEVPAGNFENCLKITTKIGGGDAGFAERFYAPNLGLILENVNAEDKQETLRLVSFKAN